jgi:hypothetical protein
MESSTALTRLEDLQAGLKLSGLLPQTVSILAVTAHGPDAVTVDEHQLMGHLVHSTGRHNGSSQQAEMFRLAAMRLPGMARGG